ncbi:TRCF domain-containing protein [Sphingomonas sp. MMS24-JH45]
MRGWQRLGHGDALDAFAEELVDRFGPMPDEAATLVAVARVRLGGARPRHREDRCRPRRDRVDAAPGRGGARHPLRSRPGGRHR